MFLKLSPKHNVDDDCVNKWLTLHFYFFHFLIEDLVYYLKITLHIREGTILFNCQCNDFWPSVADSFSKQDCSYRHSCGIQLHDADLEHSS